MTFSNRLFSNRLLNRYLDNRLRLLANWLATVPMSVLTGFVVVSMLSGCNPASVGTPSGSAADLGEPAKVVPTPAETPPTGRAPAETPLADALPATPPPADTLAADLLESSDAEQLPTGLDQGPSTAPLSSEEQAVTERLVIASINDPQAVRVFLAQMREAAGACEMGCTTEQSREAIARLVHYPFTTYEAGEIVETYNTPEDLIVDFEQVVTQSVLDAMREVRYESLFANYQGVMVGNGEVWFREYDEGLKIKAINSQS